MTYAESSHDLYERLVPKDVREGAGDGAVHWQETPDKALKRLSVEVHFVKSLAFAEVRDGAWTPSHGRVLYCTRGSIGCMGCVALLVK